MGDCVPGDHIAGGHKAPPAFDRRIPAIRPAHPCHPTGTSLPSDRHIPTFDRHIPTAAGHTPLRMNIDLWSLAGRPGKGSCTRRRLVKIGFAPCARRFSDG